MSEAAASSASILASSLGGKTTSDSTEPIIEEGESTEELTAEEEAEGTETEPTEDELPDAIKSILTKNRKLVREAEARATAAEKALAAKEGAAASDGEEAPPVDDKFKKLFVNTAAKSALAEAGLTTGTDRFLKLIDFNDVEVDDNGNISGLDDQIAELKDEFKELLAPKEAQKRSVVRGDAAGRRETPSTPKSSAQLLAERLRG